MAIFANNEVNTKLLSGDNTNIIISIIDIAEQMQICFVVFSYDIKKLVFIIGWCINIANIKN
jgi:hypothetical protein